MANQVSMYYEVRKVNTNDFMNHKFYSFFYIKPWVGEDSPHENIIGVKPNSYVFFETHLIMLKMGKWTERM